MPSHGFITYTLHNCKVEPTHEPNDACFMQAMPTHRPSIYADIRLSMLTHKVDEESCRTNDEPLEQQATTATYLLNHWLHRHKMCLPV